MLNRLCQSTFYTLTFDYFDVFLDWRFIGEHNCKNCIISTSPSFCYILLNLRESYCMQCMLRIPKKTALQDQIKHKTEEFYTKPGSKQTWRLGICIYWTYRMNCQRESHGCFAAFPGSGFIKERGSESWIGPSFLPISKGSKARKKTDIYL